MEKLQQIKADYQTIMKGFQQSKINVEQMTPYVYFEQFSLYDKNLQTISTTSIND